VGYLEGGVGIPKVEWSSSNMELGTLEGARRPLKIHRDPWMVQWPLRSPLPLSIPAQ
jgi:hypothetical protein